MFDSLADKILQRTRGEAPTTTRTAPPATAEPPRRSQADLHSGTAAKRKKPDGFASTSTTGDEGEANADPERIALPESHPVPSLFQTSFAAESPGSVSQGASVRSATVAESVNEAFSASSIALIDELAEGFIVSRIDSDRGQPANSIRSERALEDASTGSPSSQGQVVFGDASAGSPLAQIQHAISSDKQPAVEYEQDKIVINTNAPTPAVPASAQPKVIGQPEVVNSPRQQLDADKIASLINDVLIEQARRHGVDIHESQTATRRIGRYPASR